MPKPKRPRRPWPIPSSATDDKILELCAKKAGAAARKKRKSPLTDDEILFLSNVASDAYALCEGRPLADKDGSLPEISLNNLCQEKSRLLALIFVRDPAGAGLAVEAAKRESDRIGMTAEWALRREIRRQPLMKSLDTALSKVMPKTRRPKRYLDYQAISEAVEKRTGFKITLSHYKTALGAERYIDDATKK